MKRHQLLLTICLLLIRLSLPAQVQWFQNQDGNNLYPNGTIATSIQPLTATSFIACYLWHVDSDQFTWKISKTKTDGTEQQTFYVTGVMSITEVTAGHNNAVYVLQKNYPFAENPQYTLFKLDTNLTPRSQKEISFSGGYSVFSLNAFKLDERDNVYLTGDGNYPDGPGFLSASFLLKTDKDLGTSWLKMDSTQTSFSDAHIDGNGNVWVVEDFYDFFPNVKISKYTGSGEVKWKKTITTDGGRFTLASTVTEDDHLLLYGCQSISGDAQGIYLWKISRTDGNIVYQKIHFPANGIQFNDLKRDRSGSLFALVTQFYNPDRIVARVGRINSSNGNLQWSTTFPYEQDSCNLTKLVVTDNDRFYVIGEKKKDNILSRGFSLQMKKSGQVDMSYVSPDSIAFKKSHWLVDGIIDRDNKLIAIGHTQDLDPVTFQSTYLRSYVIKLGQSNNGSGCTGCNEAATTTGVTELTTKTPVVFPNPVEKELTIANLSEGKYNRLVVYNLQGSEVLQRQVTSDAVKIDISGLPGGVYLLQLQSTILQKQKTLRFVVQK